jgi:hypothetical protein
MIAAVSGAAALQVAAPKPASLAAAPARVTLAGTERKTIRVTNSGGRTAIVDIAPAGFALDLRGHPRIVRAARLRLTLRPRRLGLRPGEVSTLTVSASLPPNARAGDHPALVLLTTRPRPGAGLGVRLQIGIVVIVRVPGAVAHRLTVRRLHVRRSRAGDRLEVTLANRGDLTERLGRGRVRLTIRRHGRVLAHLLSGPREVFPRSRATESFRYRGRFRGPATALVEIDRPADGVAILRRTYRVRL